MKKLLVAAAVAASVLAAASPGGAITYGEPDDGEHPYVGFIIYWVPAEESWFSCSGTLLDQDTFLTAAHCTYGIGTDGEAVVVDGQVLTDGGTDVWATFGAEDVLEGFPPRTDFDTPEELYAARRAWLEANPAFIQGTAHHHDRYDDFSGFPVNYDVGVVELDAADLAAKPHGVTSFGELAPVGTAEALAGDTGRDRNRTAIVESVGYGIQSVQPHPMDEESRYKSTSRIVEVNGNAAKAGNLHTLNNPSPVGGRGGTCFGDSGGPVLVNDTNQVIAVVSFGFSATCHGADYSWRVDTEDSRAFVLPFLAE
jgi:secreted trypsin-like serine protease